MSASRLIFAALLLSSTYACDGAPPARTLEGAALHKSSKGGSADALSLSGAAPMPKISWYQSETNYFGFNYSDIFYTNHYGPGPVAAVSNDMVYYYDNAAVNLFPAGQAPCPGAIRWSECSGHANGIHHFLTANLVDSVPNGQDLCAIGNNAHSALVSYYGTTVAGGAPAPGILGDTCNLNADGSCPAGMVPLYWGNVSYDGPHGNPQITTILTTNAAGVYQNGVLNVPDAARAGCGPG